MKISFKFTIRISKDQPEEEIEPQPNGAESNIESRYHPNYTGFQKEEDFS